MHKRGAKLGLSLQARTYTHIYPTTQPLKPTLTCTPLVFVSQRPLPCLLSTDPCFSSTERPRQQRLRRQQLQLQL
jgi:hypothetical protein